jgi:hypothetical protein
MILEVIKATTTQKEDDETEYSVVLKGTSEFLEIKVTAKSCFKGDIEKLVPFQTGEQRKVTFSLVNRTLDEYGEDEQDV